jgi:cytochrome P450
MATTDDIYWDPFDEEIDNNPHPVWRRMRDELPVYRNDRYDFWAVSQFADVERGHLNPGVFSSAYGTVLELMGPHMGETGQIIFMDPPDHTSLRSLVSREFTPRRIGGLEARIREECVSLLDEVDGQDSFDFVQDFGAQLPSRVISMLVGVPPEDREEQRRNVDQTFHIEPGVGMINDISFAAQIASHEYLHSLAVKRREDPQDDLLSDLCAAEITGDDGEKRQLTMKEVVDFANLLYAAGTETVSRLLGNAAVIFCEYPEERTALVAQPELMGNAVEELLRYEAPSPVQARWTTQDTVFHDVTIPKESKILLLTGSAGRDDRVYEDPDRFDVRRQFRTHMSFGYGIHFCVGAALARMEGRIALEEVLKRYPSWELDEENVVRQHTSTVRGYSKVQVRLG